MSVIKQVLMGATIVAGISTITMPAFAVSLTPTNIQFTTNGVVNLDQSPNLNTWTYSTGNAIYDNTGVGNVNRRVLNDFSNYGNTTKAAAALSDQDSATNVELWTKNRSSTDRAIHDNVGFTAMLGNHQVKVESVTKADWADGTLATAWLSGFRNAYGGLMQTIIAPTNTNSNLLAEFDQNLSTLTSYLTTNGFNELGDANIGGISLDDQTNQLKVDLVGHLDAAGRYVDTRKTVVQGGKTVNNSNYLNRSPDYARNTTGNALLDKALFTLALTSFKDGKSFQMSEVAKVTFNGQVDYAFAFKAIESGAIAGDRNKTTDRTSHTGVYTWTKTVTPQSVPEPTAMLGLIAVGGLAIQRRLQKRA
jgi:hypothetical protein